MSEEDSSPPGRRRVLAVAGGGLATIALAGCLKGGTIRYESGTVPAVNASNRSAQQRIAARLSAITSPASGVSSIESLSVIDHGFVYEGGSQGSTVQGTVTNNGDDRVELAEVRVRVYDDTGAQLGQYFARTGDVDGNTDWAFTVIVLESPSSIDRYEIAVVGTPG